MLEWLFILFFGIVLILGGYFILFEVIEMIWKGKFEIDFLMLVVVVGVVFFGKWEEVVLFLFLFSLGYVLEKYVMNKVWKFIVVFFDLVFFIVLVKCNGEIMEVGIEELVIGDIIIVKFNFKIVIDGVIVKGNSIVN